MKEEKEKIGLIQLEKYPNLAIMKLKSFFGEKAELTAPIFASQYKVTYASSLFGFTIKPKLPDNAIMGGTGYNVRSRLPRDIENCQPDYSIYPECDFSFQRFTVGCVKKCPFCVAWQMVDFQDASPMSLNPKGKWIYLLDNNLLVSPDCVDHLVTLKNYNIPVQFEGIDARLLAKNQQAAHIMNQTKLKGQIHLAWDNPKINMSMYFVEILKTIPAYKLMVYVLIGYWSTPEEDLMRVEKLKELKIDSFVMPFNKFDKYQKKFARWVNHKAIFNSVKWEDYEG